VARVGRTLGKRVGLLIKSDIPSPFSYHDLGSIVEAACIAHDLGNPPFGHAGESAIRHWFANKGATYLTGLTAEEAADIAKVEGNAQGFRLITQLENHVFAGGLRLTMPTLAAFLKYPWLQHEKSHKLGAYISESAILEEVGSSLGMIRLSDGMWSRHPLAFLVEAADDVCYGLLDLEDAVELRIVSFHDVAEALLPFLSQEEQDRVRGEFIYATDARGTRTSDLAFRVNLARLRGAVFQFAVDGAYESFRDNYDKIMNGTLKGSLYDNLHDSDKRRQLVETAKGMGPKKIFPDTRKVELELGAYSTFDTLLESLCGAANVAAANLAEVSSASTLQEKKPAIDWHSTLVLRLLGDHAPSADNAAQVGGWTQYKCLRRVLDFVVGMTDNYATYVARQLRGGGFSGGQRP
jgi:dGTPase